MYQDEVVNLFKKEINKQLQSRIEINDNINLSIVEKFPQVSMGFGNIVAYDAIPDSKDTLATARKLYLTFNVLEILKGNYSVNRIYLEKASINLWVDEHGNNNYTILKSDSTKKSNVNFDLDNISLIDTKIAYRHASSQQAHKVFASDVSANISANGPLFDIAIEGDLLVEEIVIDDQVFFADKETAIDLAILFDKNSGETRFNESTLLIDHSGFSISGNFINNDHERSIDLTVEGLETNLKTLFSLLPPNVTGELSRYEGEGDVSFQATLKGDLNAYTSPFINIDFACKNGSLFQPELNSKIRDLNFEGHFDNGKRHNLYGATISLKHISATFDDKNFTGSFSLKNFKAPYISAHIDGELNLTTLSGFIAIDELEQLSGVINGDVKIQGAVKAISEKKGFQTSGKIALQNVLVKLKSLPYSFSYIEGSVKFDHNDLILNNVKSKVGKSDIKINGAIRNFMGYLFANEHNKLIADNLKLTSEKLDLDELIVSTVKKEESENQPVEFSLLNMLEGTINCRVGKVNLQRFRGNNIKVALGIKQDILTFDNISANTNSGKVDFDAKVYLKSTDSIKVWVKNLDLDQVLIDSAFYVFHNFNQSFITDKNIKGKLTANGFVNFTLNNYLDLYAPTVDAVINVIINDGELINFDPLEQSMADVVDPEELKHIRFDELSNVITLNNNKIDIPEMLIRSSVRKLSYKLKLPVLNDNAVKLSPKVLGIRVRGTHWFDNRVNYHIESTIKLLNSDLLRIRMCSDITGNSEDYLVNNYNCKTAPSNNPDQQTNDIIVVPPDGQDDDDDYIIIDEDDNFEFD